MRFIPSSCLKPGMVTAKDLYGYNNELMLSEGQVLSRIEIIRINLLKFQGIFIEDELSADIEVENVIDLKLKNNTVKALKEIFKQTERGEVEYEDISYLKNKVDDIINDLIENKNVAINMIDLKIFDDYTYYHSVNVFILSIIIGISKGMQKQELYKLGMGALLHDIGKVFVPKEVLDKPGKLTDDEFEIIKTHSKKGSDYLRDKWDISNESNLAVLTHHEKVDGTGYPYQLKGEKIPEYGKIISVADVYDALTSDRPYRKSMLPSEAVEYIMGGSGTLFEPSIVEVFVARVMPYPIGTCVKLSNGLIGIVVENYTENCMRPKIKIISKSKNDDTYCDLYHERELLNVTIIEIADL
ncbi:MAG: phosphohydrolase [Clostridiales bacterium 43-6]|nr:MAG: phosphohydrolase [Clostridiales bacterium 43-6]